MSSRLPVLVPLLTVLAALALALVAGFCLQQLLLLDTLHTEIAARQAAIAETQNAFLHLHEAVAAKRALLLTGDARQRTTFDSMAALLTGWTRATPPPFVPAAEHAALVRAIAARLAFSQRQVALHQQQPAAAIALSASPEASLLSESSGAAFAVLHAHLYRGLQQALARQQALTGDVMLLIGLCGVLVTLLILPYGLSLHRNLLRLQATRETLQASNALNDSLLRTIPLPMDIVTVDGMLRYQNDPMRAIRGDGATGRPCWETLRGDRQQCPACPLRGPLEPGITRTITETGAHNGRTYVVSHTGMDWQGQAAVLEIFHDITGLAAAEKQLRAYAQQLEWNNMRLATAVAEAQAASRAKSSFLATMSHELRTPLNSVIGFATVLLKDATLTGDSRLFAERILANGKHLLATINDILDINRIESGRAQLTFAPADPAALVADVLRQAAALRPDGRVRLVFDPPASCAPLYTDAQRFRQIIYNLVGNALKFTAAGSVTLHLETDPATGLPLRLSVSDTGIGIPADCRDRIFSPFFQVDTGPARQYEGSGLGLAIVQALCTQLNFTITVDSEVGRGSVFTVHLHPYTPFPVAGSAPALPPPPGDLLPVRLLLACDDRFAGTALLADLRVLTSRLLTAGSTAELCTLAAAQPPDVLLLLVPFAGLDTAGLAAFLAGHPALRALPCLLLDDGATAPPLLPSHLQVLPRPFTRDALCAALDRLLTPGGGLLLS